MSGELPIQAPIQAKDGVALIERGDTILVLYQAPARLHRTRFVFDAADSLAARNPRGIVAMMVLLSTSHPPDAITRQENMVRLRKLEGAVRRLVAVPTGDGTFISLARSVLRSMALVAQTRIQIAHTVSEGIDSLLEAAGPETPNRGLLERDVRSLYEMLGTKLDAL